MGARPAAHALAVGDEVLDAQPARAAHNVDDLVVAGGAVALDLQRELDHVLQGHIALGDADHRSLDMIDLEAERHAAMLSAQSASPQPPGVRRRSTLNPKEDPYGESYPGRRHPAQGRPPHR